MFIHFYCLFELGAVLVPSYAFGYLPIRKRSVKSILHVHVTLQDFNISIKFTKFCIISLPYHLYIEKKCAKVQKSFEDIAEHLFTIAKVNFWLK